MLVCKSVFAWDQDLSTNAEQARWMAELY